MNHGCKTSITALAFAAAVDAAPTADPVQALRDCVREATSAIEVAACEAQATAAFRARIKRLEDAIFAELDNQQRRLFEGNIEAWKRFLESEAEMSAFAFGSRSDGLGAQLRLGESNRLLEQRFDQLRAYLVSLKQRQAGSE